MSAGSQGARPRAQVVVVENDTILRASLGELLRRAGHQVFAADTVRSALDFIARQPVHVVLSDVNMPQADGFELLAILRARHPEVVTVLITAYGTIDSAVDAIKLGAYDYLTKPIADDELRLVIERAIQQQALRAENRVLRDQLKGSSNGAILGHDHQVLRIMEVVETVADSRVTVLIHGESGTGKSLIARAVHRCSGRRACPFIEVSCGALPEGLLESELFGHVQGAFTGAVADKEGKFKAADGGTLFLDEIATASRGLQVKLLRVLQDRQFEPLGSNRTETIDVRVVLATNVDLQSEVRRGRFREDLYYRINVVNVEVPPLRARRGDVALLAQRFLERFAAESGKQVLGLDAAVLQVLEGYDWPGNVRELENAIERAVVFCRGSHITMAELPAHVQGRAAPQAGEEAAPHQTLQEALAGPERRIIEAALRQYDWNRQATAMALGINRTTLYKKMKRLGIPAQIHSMITSRAG